MREVVLQKLLILGSIRCASVRGESLSTGNKDRFRTFSMDPKGQAKQAEEGDERHCLHSGAILLDSLAGVTLPSSFYIFTVLYDYRLHNAQQRVIEAGWRGAS